MRVRILCAVGLLAVAACSDDRLTRAPEPVNGLFDRYVSVGNSITAGFQSGGITAVTQAESYAVLLAAQMETEFFVPWMNLPGCPPPFANVFTGTSTFPGVDCALRRREAFPPPYLNNVAVPGAEVIDVVANLDAESNANELTQFFLGGLTQAQMLQRVDPTFVSVWIGNNDVLGAALAGGDTTRITAPTLFASRYAQMMTSVNAGSPGGGVLIGVANVTAIPFFSLGSTYWAIDNGLVTGQAFPPSFVVDNNCAPDATMIPGARGDRTLVPFPYGGALLAAAQGGAPATLSCADAVTEVMVPDELTAFVTAVTAYNAEIAARAAARSWAYLDPNPALDSLRAIPTEVAPFPAFGAPCSANPFGLAISCDGVHPSARTHKLLANKLIQAINTRYGTSIAQIP